MKASGDPRGRARGFTLVELVTVMGILAILMAIVIGGIQGVRTKAKREGTMELIAALDAGLASYFNDWRKYPWINDTDHPLMSKVEVGTTAMPGYLPASSGSPNYIEAMLYASMNMRQRKGPYVSGFGQATLMLPGPYVVYVDGWGRPILYGIPDPGSNAKSRTPRLESLGADEFDPADNLKNYPYDVSNSLEKGR